MTRRAKSGIVAALAILAGQGLEGRRNPFVAQEGIPFLVLSAVGFVVALRYLDIAIAIAFALVFFVFVLIFRDPRRSIPSAPLGVVSPVDGQIIDVDLADKGVLHGEAHRVRIEIDSLGTYTARAPVEGKVLNLRSVDGDQVADYETNAMWIQTDEGDDVVLQFNGYRFGLAPKAFTRYGERLGQGQRCAYLRLTRVAELHLPIASTVLVKPGQVVRAGSDLIGKVPHP